MTSDAIVEKKEGERLREISKRPARRFLTWLGLLALIGSAAVGSNLFSIRDRLFGTAVPEPAPAASSREAEEPGVQTAPVPAPTALRSQPWWQDVTALEGTGSMTSPSFTIAEDAIQWRVTWTCDPGDLRVVIPDREDPMVQGSCNEGGIGYSSQSGVTTLEVSADGPWQLEIAQQIDAPLVEPPWPAMTAAGAAILATGSFYGIDKTATGSVTVYRQTDGQYALRLDDFFVSATADLEMRLSTLEGPLTTETFAGTPSELLSFMDVTAGSLNYAVPAELDPTQFRSLVIWCAPINSAYGAASLEVVR